MDDSRSIKSLKDLSGYVNREFTMQMESGHSAEVDLAMDDENEDN
jgi:hypothetical protein